jgi:hypothetical protein
MKRNWLSPTKLLSFYFLLLVQFGCSTPCTRNLDQAPELRGFRLGANISQIQSRFLGFPELSPNEFGLAKVIIQASSISEAVKPTGGGYVLVSASRYPEIVGTDKIILEFVDGKLALMKVYYPDDVKWNSVDEFVKKTSESLNLPDGWETPEYTKDYQHVYCKGFFVRAGRDNEKYDEKKLPFIEVGDTLASIQPSFREIDKKREAERKEAERRQTFKP